VILVAASSIACGTYFGGWRIIRTLGTKVIHLDPIHGFAAETSSAAVIWTASVLGYPISTTQTITASIMGAGTTGGLSAVKWGVAGNIIWAWVLTIPAAGLVAAGAYFLIHLLH
jgi:PiT family inorganic phosphate transporter